MTDKEIHVGGQGLPLWRRLVTRRTIILLLGVLIIVGTAFGVYHYRSVSKESHIKVSTAIKSADEGNLKGDFEGSYRSLKQASETAQSKADKVQVLNNLALAAANSGRLQEAIGYFNEKHTLDPDSKKADAAIVAEYYERLHDKPHAVEWYKIALENAKTSKQASQYDPVKIYEARIKALEE